MSGDERLTREQLVERADRFFVRYGDEVDSVRRLLQIRLEQLARAYTLQHGLPNEAVSIYSRCKTLRSFLKKLENKGWPQFYYPTEVAADLIGARVVCWFLDDCHGFVDYLTQSKHIRVRPDSVEDFIIKPKPSGYRSIHFLADMQYDRVSKRGTERVVDNGDIVCEIQIRTKLQDAWGEFTHEMHYKVTGGVAPDFNTLVKAISDRLATEDSSVVAIRKLLQLDPSADKHEGLHTPDR